MSHLKLHGLLVLLILLCGNPIAWSRGSENLLFDFSFGKPVASISNPDGSLAYYDGLSSNAKFIVPIWGNSAMTLKGLASLNYFDLKNTTTQSVTETAQAIGPGLGLELRTFGLLLGATAHMMRIRHQLISSVVSNNLEYSFMLNGFYIGYEKSFKNLRIGVLKTDSTASLPSGDNGLSQKSTFTESTIWLTIRYDFGVGANQFLSTFFK